MSGHALWALIRFKVDDDQGFRELATAAVEHWLACPGCLHAELVCNLDDPSLWAIITRWTDVGSYRRSFTGYEAKMALTRLLSQAINEPSAFLPPDEIGAPQWRNA